VPTFNANHDKSLDSMDRVDEVRQSALIRRSPDAIE
jgi:hypothetical protein